MYSDEQVQNYLQSRGGRDWVRRKPKTSRMPAQAAFDTEPARDSVVLRFWLPLRIITPPPRPPGPPGTQTPTLSKSVQDGTFSY